MKLLRLLLLFTLFLAPSSQAHAAWTNEPAGASVIYDCNYALTDCGWTNVYNTSKYAQPGGAGTPESAPYAFDQELAVNAIVGNGQWELNFAERDEIYVGMMLQANADFVGLVNNGNKVMFISNNKGDNSLISWYGLRGPGVRTILTHQQSIVNNCQVSGYSTFACWPQDGTGLFFPNINAGAAQFAPGSGWHRIEVYMKKSTSPSSADGIMRHWVDGVLTTNHTNVNFIGGWSKVHFTATWDGAGEYVCTTNGGPRDCSKAWHWYLDHLKVSIPNCPLGCPGGPTTPPPPPPPPPPTPPPPPPGSYVYQSQFSGTQGTSQWSYRDTAGNLLAFNSSSNIWNGGQAYLTIWNNGFHPGTSNGAVLRWTAPEAGTATITGAAQKTDLAGGDGVEFRIKNNAGSNLFAKDISGTDGTSYPYNVSQAVTTGQVIDFVVNPGGTNSNDSMQLNPTIAWEPTSGSAPTISGLSPSSGAVGTPVTITGTNFVPSLQGNTVTFSGIAAIVTSASTTSITANVPPHALTGTVKVITSLGTGTSGGNFTVPLSGAVEDISDLTATALSTTSVTVQFTALSDGTGAAAKHDIRIEQGVISWGDASSVASGTCTSPYQPGVTNTPVTCTITGLTAGEQYGIQLVAYKGTPNVDAVYSNLSNVANVTTMGTVIDVPVICSAPPAGASRVNDRCPKPPARLMVTR